MSTWRYVDTYTDYPAPVGKMGLPDAYVVGKGFYTCAAATVTSPGLSITQPEVQNECY